MFKYFRSFFVFVLKIGHVFRYLYNFTQFILKGNVRMYLIPYRIRNNVKSLLVRLMLHISNFMSLLLMKCTVYVMETYLRNVIGYKKRNCIKSCSSALTMKIAQFFWGEFFESRNHISVKLGTLFCISLKSNFRRVKGEEVHQVWFKYF